MTQSELKCLQFTLINSKSEFHQAPLVGVVPVVGLLEEQGEEEQGEGGGGKGQG